MLLARFARTWVCGIGVICLSGSALAQQPAAADTAAEAKPSSASSAAKGTASTWGFARQPAASTFGVSAAKKGENNLPDVKSAAVPQPVSTSSDASRATASNPTVPSSGVKTSVSSAKTSSTSVHAKGVSTTHSTNPFTPPASEPNGVAQHESLGASSRLGFGGAPAGGETSGGMSHSSVRRNAAGPMGDLEAKRMSDKKKMKKKLGKAKRHKLGERGSTGLASGRL